MIFKQHQSQEERWMEQLTGMISLKQWWNTTPKEKEKKWIVLQLHLIALNIRKPHNLKVSIERRCKIKMTFR